MGGCLWFRAKRGVRKAIRDAIEVEGPTGMDISMVSAAVKLEDDEKQKQHVMRRHYSLDRSVNEGKESPGYHVAAIEEEKPKCKLIFLRLTDVKFKFVVFCHLDPLGVTTVSENIQTIG